MKRDAPAVGTDREDVPVPVNDTPRGEFASVTARKVGKRLAGPSRRSPLPSARTKKMPSPRGGSGVRAGSNENCFVTSKTTPEPSGSTAMRWKTPATLRTSAPLRDSPQTRHTPSGSGTGVEGATSMTVTGSQFPRRTRSFCFSPSSAPAGRWCTRSPRRRASGCARPARCRCSARRRPPGSPGAPGRPRDTSACTRPAAACRCCGTPPRHFLAWLRATGQRSPRGTVLDDETEITAYCHPLRGVNATAGARDQIRLGAGAPLPRPRPQVMGRGVALLPHLRRASPLAPVAPARSRLSSGDPSASTRASFKTASWARVTSCCHDLSQCLPATQATETIRQSATSASTILAGLFPVGGASWPSGSKRARSTSTPDPAHPTAWTV